MPIPVRCEPCGKTYPVPDRYAGKRGKCPFGHPLVVPAATRARERTAPEDRWQALVTAAVEAGEDRAAILVAGAAVRDALPAMGAWLMRQLKTGDPRAVANAVTALEAAARGGYSDLIAPWLAEAVTVYGNRPGGDDAMWQRIKDILVEDDEEEEDWSPDTEPGAPQPPEVAGEELVAPEPCDPSEIVFRGLRCPLCKAPLPDQRRENPRVGGGSVLSCPGCNLQVAFSYLISEPRAIYLSMHTLPAGRADPGRVRYTA